MTSKHSKFLCTLMILALTGCWGVTGSNLKPGPEALMVLAQDAQGRNDHRAYQNYLGRILLDHPESPQAKRARLLLDQSHTKDPGIMLPSAPRPPDEPSKAPPPP